MWFYNSKVTEIFIVNVRNNIGKKVNSGSISVARVRDEKSCRSRFGSNVATDYCNSARTPFKTGFELFKDPTYADVNSNTRIPSNLQIRHILLLT